ncbi:MAG: hypothetical protein Q7U40_14615 [Desulfatirhabdiaceae bacterium]|nr:hypothetical protein [Desulfatirhabdiaceae bacterium]
MTQKAATLSCLQHTDIHFPDARRSISSSIIIISVISNGKALSIAVSKKKKNKDNSSLFELYSFSSSIIVIEFQMADYGGRDIVCQGN